MPEPRRPMTSGARAFWGGYLKPPPLSVTNPQSREALALSVLTSQAVEANSKWLAGQIAALRRELRAKAYAFDESKIRREQKGQTGGGRFADRPSAGGDAQAKSGPGIIRDQTADAILSSGEVWLNSLDAQERRATERYRASAYTEVNRYLRQGDVMGNDSREVLQSLAAAMRTASLPTGVAVFRGADALRDLSVGDVFVDKGYGSASLRPEVAVRFSSQVARIHLPRSARAVAISMKNDPEEEILVDAGSAFRVTGRKTVRVPFRGRIEEITLVDIDLIRQR